MENDKNIAIDVPLFISFRQAFFNECTKKNTNTICAYQKALDSFHKFLQLKKTQIINNETLNDYKDYLLRTKKLKENTIHSYFTGLSRYFNYLVKSKVINQNPVKNIKYKITKKNGKIRYFTCKQIDKIINNIDDTSLNGLRDIAMIKFIAQTGLKESVIADLKIKHLIHNGKYWYLPFRVVSGDKYKMKIGLSPSLIKSLENYFSQRELKKNSKEEYIFISHSNRTKSKKMSVRGIREMIKIRIRNSDIKEKHKKKLTPAALRNTGIINVLSKIKLRQPVKDFFGIKLDVTLEKYVVICREQVK